MRPDADYAWFFRSSYVPVARTVFLIVGDRSRADEITFGAFVRMLREWRRVLEEEHPEVWVRRAAVRTAVRAAARAGSRPAGRAMPAPIRVPSGPPRWVGPDGTAAGLSPSARAVLVLSFWENRTVSETARIVGISEVAVRRHLDPAAGWDVTGVTAGMAAGAELLSPDVEERLAAATEVRSHELRRRWIVVAALAALVTTVVLVVSAGGRSRPAAVGVEQPQPVRPSYVGPRIPDGTWTRQVTRAQARVRGLAAAAAREVLGDRRRATVTISISGDQWRLQVTGDGGPEVGSLSYDQGGRLIIVTESAGCRGCVGTYDWLASESVLRLAYTPGVGRPTGAQRLVREGVFHAAR